MSEKNVEKNVVDVTNAKTENQTEKKADTKPYRPIAILHAHVRAWSGKTGYVTCLVQSKKTGMYHVMGFTDLSNAGQIDGKFHRKTGLAEMLRSVVGCKQIIVGKGNVERYLAENNIKVVNKSMPFEVLGDAKSGGASIAVEKAGNGLPA